MGTRAAWPGAGGGAGDLSPAVLAHVPGFGPGEALPSVSALSGGSANRSFLVETRAGRFVVRLHAQDSVLDAGARAREVAVHTLAARVGLAPRIIWASDAGYALITEHVDGRVWSGHDVEEPAQLRKLCATWRALRELPPPRIARFDAAATARRYRAAIHPADEADGRALDASLEEAVGLANALAAEGRAVTPVHGDPHVSNIVEEAGRLLLIDWEYATLADPLVDPGCLLAYYPAVRPMAQRVLEWSGLHSTADVPALLRTCRLYELLTLLWSRATAASGADPAESAD
jgi:aminoglycoside phosphotransferase (APT) family kinase protein